MVNNQQAIINRIHKLLCRHLFIIQKMIFLLLLLTLLLCESVLYDVGDVTQELMAGHLLCLHVCDVGKYASCQMLLLSIVI